MGNTYLLDVSKNPKDFDSMGYQALSPMNVPRGDFNAVELYGYAYLAGGITDESMWCLSLDTVERYHMATDTWETIEPLNVGVDDSAMCKLRGKIISIGGETKPWDCATLPDPASASLPGDHVEVLDPALGTDANWIVFSDFKEDRFRFAAAAVPALSRIYTFGGQKSFNEDCQCFATSDAVVYAAESSEQEPDTSAGLSPGAIAGISIAAVVGVAVASFFTWKCFRKDKEYSTSE